MMNIIKEWHGLEEEIKNAFLHRLGPLAYLVGVWKGTGFTVISRPSSQPDQTFQFHVNETSEELLFTPLLLSVTNRGENPQVDIKLNGLSYKQVIVDSANVSNVLHFENGQWLLIPATVKPISKASLSRQATILHGATFIATGDAPSMDPNQSAPVIESTDTTPIPIGGGTLDDKYLKKIKCTVPPEGIPDGSMKNPNLVLTKSLSNEHVLDYVKFCVTAKLQSADATDDPTSPGGVGPGISNIPFLDQNAQVREVRSTFYVEHIEDAAGESFMQLQYSQRVILRFAEIDWPHVSVATLRRVLL